MNTENGEIGQGVETLQISFDLIDHVLTCEVEKERKRYEKGSYIYSQDDLDEFFYLVIDGYVEIIFMNQLGQETIVDIVGPGALCGEGAAFEGLARTTSARGLTSTELVRLTASDVRSYCRRDQQLANLLITTISVKQRVLLERLMQMAQMPSLERVRKLLLQIGGNSDELLVAISHEKIASLTGLTRVTVTRAISKLCKNGEIIKRNGKIYLGCGRKLLVDCA
ncbi:MAG: Crp/Fnr family transcriptional regulator [Alphaproteobacteria bacterium]|nr:hypothetical protein [Rhodospirillaceae bacterium]MDP6406717.1 Crp/Fnr family transcriptional regulator [Alphaproteobacteria bacterium]MDP6621176.1 Crp/Fnr family transcriptional regulator [Alphaproteobacteria bacterium]